MPYFFLIILIITIIGFSYSSITQVILLSNNDNRYIAYGSLPDFNFAAAGDWGCTDITTHTVNNILDKDPQLVIGLGDFSYEPTADCWFEKIAPIDDRMKIAIGNHDDSYERQENPTLLKQYMTNFNLSRQFYSFDYQNVHFTALSTELPYSVGTDQYEFINDDLASAASDPNIDWIVVYYHKLAYTSPSAHHNASNELREEYHTLFGRYDVDLVLQAHNHNYERSYPIKYNGANPSAPIITDNKTNNYLNPEGQIFVTVGTAGADLYEFLTKAPYIYTQYVGHGFLNIDVVDNGQTFNATFYSNDGSIRDQFSITKGSDASAAGTDEML